MTDDITILPPDNLPSAPDSNLPIPATLTLDDMIARFLAEQDIAKSSRATYARNIEWYFKWVTDTERHLPTLTLTDILAYKDYLVAKKLGTSTVGSYLIVVRLFYEWAEARKYYPNITKGMKLPRGKKEFQKMPLTAPQAAAFLAYFQARIDGKEGDDKTSAVRDFALVNLLIRTGLREMEAIGADIESISSRGGKRCLFVRGKGKTDKSDYVVLTDKAYGPISEYLALRVNALMGDAIFVNQNGKRLNTSHVRKIVKKALRAIGLTDRCYSTHSLRHTAASLVVGAMGSSEGAQAMLRHTNASTTMLYTSVAREQNRLENPPEEVLDGLF